MRLQKVSKYQWLEESLSQYRARECCGGQRVQQKTPLPLQVGEAAHSGHFWEHCGLPQGCKVSFSQRPIHPLLSSWAVLWPGPEEAVSSLCLQALSRCPPHRALAGDLSLSGRNRHESAPQATCISFQVSARYEGTSEREASIFPLNAHLHSSKTKLLT